MERSHSVGTKRRIGTILAASVVAAAAALTITAAPAQAAPRTSSVQAGTHTIHPDIPNCWGSYTISPDGWGFIQASSATFCSTTATQMGVTIQIRQRDPFGYVSNCGGSATASDYNVKNVMATVYSCIDMGAGYTYWAYSSNWASVNGEYVSFNSGNWNG